MQAEKEMPPKKRTEPETELEPAPALDSAATPALASASEPSYGLSGEAGASPPAPTPGTCASD